MQKEAEKFRRLADKWWDKRGVFGALHSMNDVSSGNAFVGNNQSSYGTQRKRLQLNLFSVTVLKAEQECNVGASKMQHSACAVCVNNKLTVSQG